MLSMVHTNDTVKLTIADAAELLGLDRDIRRQRCKPPQTDNSTPTSILLHFPQKISVKYSLWVYVLGLHIGAHLLTPRAMDVLIDPCHPVLSPDSPPPCRQQ